MLSSIFARLPRNDTSQWKPFPLEITAPHLVLLSWVGNMIRLVPD